MSCQQRVRFNYLFKVPRVIHSPSCSPTLRHRLIFRVHRHTAGDHLSRDLLLSDLNLNECSAFLLVTHFNGVWLQAQRHLFYMHRHAHRSLLRHSAQVLNHWLDHICVCYLQTWVSNDYVHYYSWSSLSLLFLFYNWTSDPHIWEDRLIRQHVGLQWQIHCRLAAIKSINMLTETHIWFESLWFEVATEVHLLSCCCESKLQLLSSTIIYVCQYVFPSGFDAAKNMIYIMMLHVHIVIPEYVLLCVCGHYNSDNVIIKKIKIKNRSDSLSFHDQTHQVCKSHYKQRKLVKTGKKHPPPLLVWRLPGCEWRMSCVKLTKRQVS